jgi:tight adherence protein C
MIIILLIGVLLLGVAAALGIRALSAPRVAAAERLTQIGDYGFGRAEPEPKVERATLGDAVDHTATRLGDWAASHLGSFREEDIRKQLIAAGMYRVSPTTFLGYRVISTILFPLFFIWFVSIGGVGASLGIFLVALSLGVGWVLPMTYLRQRVNKRHEAIETGLPELIDLLVLTVEAGLAFNASLQTAATRMRGPLGDELRLTLQEQSFGLALNQALGNLMVRCDTVSMRSFVRSVIQGETLGVSIGTILRNLALEMRKRRRANAEERAQKAPIKILFPLVILIFPALFAVLLYPALSEFAHTFGG